MAKELGLSASDHDKDKGKQTIPLKSRSILSVLDQQCNLVNLYTKDITIGGENVNF